MHYHKTGIPYFTRCFHRPSRDSGSTARPPGDIKTRLDIEKLDAAVELFSSGLAESTQQAYKSAKRRYVHFCVQHETCPIPATENQLCQYVSYLALQNLSHSTIKSYLAAVRHLHVAERQGTPKFAKCPT